MRLGLRKMRVAEEEEDGSVRCNIAVQCYNAYGLLCSAAVCALGMR